DLALIYFKEEGVDYAVIEVGIGGALDSTNIIDSDLAVITNVSMDHADVLGDTLQEIALQKAGIIKSSMPVVLGYYANLQAVHKQIEKMGAKAYIMDSYEDYQQENKAIADKALELLGMKTCKEKAHLRGRFEQCGKYVFDMAHNQNAFWSLKTKVEKLYPQKNIIAIWNMAKNKEARKCLDILSSFVEAVYFYPVNNERLLSLEDVKRLGLKSYAGQEAEVILVCGSIYLISELLPLQ
ncbi:hypothetical protein K0U07_03890, partial [bacterium]|nr:hypothetical protein [bacterium]